MKREIKIGNAQAFWGDSPDAAALLLQQQPDLDYITLDYLSEVSLSIMAIQREKDPEAGYAKDFVAVIASLIPAWKAGSRVKIITNAGGLDPQRCADACAKVLAAAGIPRKRIGVVTGDDVLGAIRGQPTEKHFHNMDSGDSVVTVLKDLVTANAYLGAEPIVDALHKGADIVITGRTADPSLTVAPCVTEFGWAWDDYDRLAQATLAGHLIECGTQATGGISTEWLQIADPAAIGFPFVEMSADGGFVLTKPDAAGGVVDRNTVREQLLYELGDPEAYISPDLVMSVLDVTLEEAGPNRIAVKGAKGRAPTPYLKVSATYRDGFRSEGSLIIVGQDVREKAQRTGEVIATKMREAGLEPERIVVECLGTGDVVPGIVEKPNHAFGECVMRVAIADHRPEVLEYFTHLIAPLVTAGAPGTTGYTTGRPHVRPIFGFWPCLIPREQVKIGIS